MLSVRTCERFFSLAVKAAAGIFLLAFSLAGTWELAHGLLHAAEQAAGHSYQAAGCCDLHDGSESHSHSEGLQPAVTLPRRAADQACDKCASPILPVSALLSRPPVHKFNVAQPVVPSCASRRWPAARIRPPPAA